MVLAYSSCSWWWIVSHCLMVCMSDSAIPQSLTGSLRSKPWRILAVVVGEMGSVWGIGMSTGVLALGERYRSMAISMSGEWNGSGSGKLVHDEGT